MVSSIYYLPGHGGRLGTGLGEGLLSRGFDVAGRETVGEFKDLSFDEQVALVAQDLTSLYWHEENRVVANSFGAYLFLHAQAQIAPYIGRVLLLSPWHMPVVVGYRKVRKSGGREFPGTEFACLVT